LPVFPADEIVIAADDGRADDLAARARRRFPLPVRSAEERVLDAA
jgi:hypothetical protein